MYYFSLKGFDPFMSAGILSYNGDYIKYRAYLRVMDTDHSIYFEIFHFIIGLN